MGIRAKKIRAEKRKAIKRAAKEAKKKLYASYAGTGRRSNKTKKSSGPSWSRRSHEMVNCGNIGCKRCFPRLNGVDPSIVWR